MWSSPYIGYKINKSMNEPELKNFVRFLYGQVNEKDKINQYILEEKRKMRLSKPSRRGSA